MLFRSGVRIRHFIVVPAIAMAAVLGSFRLLDRIVLPGLSPGTAELYGTGRTVVISLAMASTIAFLAIRYRSGYELQLQARNEALEATRDFLSRIIEGSADAIITRDAGGGITSWNRAAEVIYGWTEAEMRGQPVDRILPAATRPREAFDLIDRELRAGRTVHDLETTGLHRSGKTIVVSITAAPLDDPAGGFGGSTAIVRDVTAVKAMEAQLLERERLAAVGELAAMIAHEVRNPLAGIRGGCQILLEGYPKGDSRNEIGVEILHLVDRLNRTVQDLLSFARPKAVDPVPTDLNALVDRLLNFLREDPANTSVELQREPGDDIPVVRVDGRQIEQVILNLLLNATQAANHRGAVRVATRSRPGWVDLEVRDTGPGIPPDRLDRVFQPFFTTRSQGTGLGLAIVKKIVEAHGGTITASSPHAGGACFVVSLPCEERPV